MTPLLRFYNLLSLDRKDVYQIVFYAIFSGMISLSLPLGIQAIISFIQSGKITASWVVLIVLVVIGVAFGGILSLMQLRITESLQQKIFIRSSFDFAFRLPKFKFDNCASFYPPELANRFFDTLTIQKGTSKLLIDFSAAFLQIVFGVLLLSLYHPFFILFGFLLLIMLYLIFKLSYVSGLETSLMESKYKYKVAGWLQEIARNYLTFKNKNNFGFALQKNDHLVSGYLGYREKHFNVIKRQYIQLIGFKMLITACLLSIGGYLVITMEMNIGQFVAAEIIILLVINSVEKIILGLETFYDVLTSVEKIGLVADMEIEETDKENAKAYKEMHIELEDVTYTIPRVANPIIDDLNLKIKQGDRLYVCGENQSGMSTLFRILAGVQNPEQGTLYVNDGGYTKLSMDQYRSNIRTYIHGESLFEGTLLENIVMGNPGVTQNDIRWAIESMKLHSFIKNLPDGIETHIQSEGNNLPTSIVQRIILARCIVAKPLVLLLQHPTDQMDDTIANEIIDFLLSKEHKWTVVVSSKNNYWRDNCNHTITLKQGRIIDEKNQ